MPLVSRTRYNAKGEPFETVDPKGIVTRTEFDALGRRVRTIQNYLPGSTAPDANVTTEFTYKAGHLTAVTAVNAATGNQTTRYEYGVSPATGSLVSRNDLLREIIYPDGGLNTVKLRYNRQGERIGMTDQNGTVHAYERDKLGRMTADEVTSLGTGIDGTVRKLGTTYNARGLVEKLTSYGPTGSVVNEVKNTYNGLNQLTEQAQSHSGAVTGGTPKVEYGYDHSASGGAFTKGARPTDITYPSGRVIDFDYGSAGGAGDKLARIEALVDGAQTLVSYSYLGVGTFVITDYVEPEVKLNYTAAASGDAKYPGFDQYNRVVQHHWTAYGASPGLRDGFDYGYDANSNRLWRANLTAQALDKPFDELYRYDWLNRLVDFQRGTLNAEHTSILGTPTKEQTWNLDTTGNWSQFTSADDGVLETDQTRISNPANEITEISSWFPPGYDHAGNMTRIPKPAAPQEGFLATWDAWNRMVTLVDASTGDTVQENAFDAQTWRTVRKDYEAGALSETRHFFYTAQWQSIEERLDAATTPERQHVWGLRYIDDLILRDRDTDDDGDLDERLYAMQDANWSVTSVTARSGAVQERYAYVAYGQPQFLEANFDTLATSAYHWNRLFTGQGRESTAQLYLLRKRAFHPQLGEWITRDPIGYLDTMNLYLQALSNPFANVDPFGLSIYILLEGKDSEAFQSAVMNALEAICPCVRIDVIETAISSFPPPYKNKETFSRLSANKAPGMDTRDAFCRCIDDHVAGCTMLHDLLTAENPRGRLEIRRRTLPGGNFDIGDQLLGGNRYFRDNINWNPDYSGPPEAPSSTSPLVLAHEMFHAWQTQWIQSPKTKEWERRVLIHTKQNVRIPETNLPWKEAWAVQAENQVGREVYGESYKNRETYPVNKKQVAVPEFTTRQSGPCPDCDGWFKALSLGWK